MLAHVKPPHNPRVREVAGDRILETIGPGTPLVVLWAYQADRLVVITPRHMGHVASEFVVLDGGDVAELEARVDVLTEQIGANALTIKGLASTLNAVGHVIRTWEVWDGQRDSA